MPPEIESNDSDGVASYQGYEYQILATVWLALELLFGREGCEAVLVEPATGEDVAANLRVPPERAVSFVSFVAGQCNLQVQIKLRRTDQWTEARFAEVVRGPNRADGMTERRGRKRPITLLLESETARFVLLTNAQVNKDLCPFLIERLGDVSEATAIPGETIPGETAATAQRIGILQQQHPTVLSAEIARLLQRASVPSADREKCAVKLTDMVRDRLLRKIDPSLTKQELQAVLRAYDGLPAEEPGEFFVPPANYPRMLQRLEEQHRLLIVGPPGVGKTLAAGQLVLHHRQMDDAFKVVSSEGGPSEIAKRLDQPDRFLFFLEDPWGQFKLSSDSDRWTTELPKLLKRAGPDKRFLITSRAAIRITAFGGNVPFEISSAEERLLESDYDAKKRLEILDLAITGARSWQRDFTIQHREEILRHLLAPYSLTLFASRLKQIQDASSADLRKLINDCNIEVISSTIASEIQSLGTEAVADAVAIWAWIMAQCKLDLAVRRRFVRWCERAVTRNQLIHANY